MKKPSTYINKDVGSSKKAKGIPEESYVFVRYSDFMDFIQNVRDASIALSKVAKESSDIKLMSLRPEAREKIGEGLSQKLTGISDTKHSMRSHNKQSEADESEKDTGQILRSFDSHLRDSQNGLMKRSRKK